MRKPIRINFGTARVYDKKKLKRYISKTIENFQQECAQFQVLGNLRTQIEFDSNGLNSKVRCQITMSTGDQMFKVHSTETDFRANHAYNRTLRKLKKELSYEYLLESGVSYVA